MKKFIITFLGCLCALTVSYAQKIAGKVVDASGNGISYVNIGVVDSGIGTIADRDGNFTLTLPDTLADGTILTVTHISYVPLEIPVGRVGEYGGGLTKLVFKLTEKEYKIAEVSIIAKKKKPQKLAGRGTRLPIGSGVYAETGIEAGTVVDVEDEFVVKHFEFTVLKNRDDFTRMRINVYRVISGDDIRNILNYPIYVDLNKFDSPDTFVVELTETVVLEKGQYFVSLEFVEASGNKGAQFPIYMKTSYRRSETMGPLERSQVNPGILVYGYEIKH